MRWVVVDDAVRRRGPRENRGASWGTAVGLAITSAGLAFSTMVFAPTVVADVPHLDPFVGSWHAHEESLGIQPDGHGRETYADRTSCPNAPMSGCGLVGTTDFTLTRVDGDTANGTITAASNATHPVGGPVSLALVGDGQGLELTIAGGDQGFPFCNADTHAHANAHANYFCGA